MNKKFFIKIVVIFLVFWGSSVNAQDLEPQVDYATGVVLEIQDAGQNDILNESLGGQHIVQNAKIKILSGQYKGETVQVENQLTSNPAYDVNIKKGDRVLLDIEKVADSIDVYLADKERAPTLLILTGIFFLLILAVGGMKGLNSLLSLLITSVLIFFVLVPSILKGLNILLVSVLVAMASTFATMFIVGGFNRKSLSASIGTITTLFIAGLLSLITINLAGLTGFGSQESIILWSSRPDINFIGLLSSAMIIGALGAVMDIGMSIASCIAELKQTDSTLTSAQLIKSGMNVGKDIIGTMANTLILVYIGTSLPLILLAADAPLIKLINLNSISTEISAALIGSIGIILCVPITAVVSGYLIGYKK